MKWDLLDMKLLWAELWKKDQFRIGFLLKSEYDTFHLLQSCNNGD